MKKAIKTASLVLLVIAAIFSSSCSTDRGTPVMTLQDASVTDHMFEYWVDSYKAALLSRYADAKDTDEFWDKPLGDGATAESYFYDLTYDYIRTNLVSMYLFDEFGLEIEDEDREKASDIIDELEESYANGNRNDFNRALAKYGVNADLLEEIYIEEQKSVYVYNHVFENNILVVGDAEKEEYLNDNYVRIRQIYINNKYDFDKSYYDDAGNFVMIDLDEAVKAEKDAKVEEVKALLDSGADFDEVYEKYSEETAYPNGYYLSVTTQNLPSELITNAFSLAVGETAQFESDYGTHFIKRLEMNEGAYADSANSDFFDDFTESVYESVFEDYIASYYDKIEVDEEAIKNYTIRNSPPNYYFQY